MTTYDDAPVTRREFQAFRDEFHRELQHYATKADLAEMKTDLIKWMVGLMLGSIAAASTIALFMQRLLDG